LSGKELKVEFFSVDDGLTGKGERVRGKARVAKGRDGGRRRFGGERKDRKVESKPV